MLTVEKQHSLSLLEQKLNFMCPVCIITVRQVPFHLKDRFLLYLAARYWEDPHTFRPERFLKDWPRDAFMTFSSGEFGPIGLSCRAS